MLYFIYLVTTFKLTGVAFSSVWILGHWPSSSEEISFVTASQNFLEGLRTMINRRGVRPVFFSLAQFESVAHRCPWLQRWADGRAE